MKKKILAITVCVMIVMCMIPQTAFASTDNCPIVGIGHFTVLTSDNLGKAVSLNIDNSMDSGTAKLTGDDDNGYVLTLDNISVKSFYTEGNRGHGIIISWPIQITDAEPNALTINLKGTNTLEYEPVDDIDAGFGFGVYGSANINSINGGSLNIKNFADGIYAFDDLSVNANIQITNASRLGIYVGKDINFSGSSKVGVTSQNSLPDLGIISGHDINFNLTKGGKVNAYGSECAISTRSVDTITLARNNIITAPENGAIFANERTGAAYITVSGSETPATHAVVEYVGSVAPKTIVKDKSPQTGDGDNMPLYVLLGLSAAVAGTVCYRKSQNA